MKLSRPALASAAALTIAVGSFTAVTVVKAEDTSTLIDATAPLGADQADAAAADAADLGGDSGVSGDSGADSGTDTARDADAADSSAADTDAAGTALQDTGKETGAQRDPGTTASDINAVVNGLTRQDDVDPELAAAAQHVPDQNGTPATTAAMRKMTGPADAPRQVSGDRTKPQYWYGTKGVEGWYVHSESMKRDIPVALIRATDPQGNAVDNAPTLYMLNGAGGAEQDSDWVAVADAQDFYKGKSVNVVIPMEGAFSYYVDWLTDGDTLKAKSNYFKGEQKWSTFLGKELPPAVEKELGANETRGILGFSMSGTSSLLLAEQHPELYDAVGSFSGCAATSTPLPWAFAALTVNRAAKTPNYTSITPAHIWGPMGSPYNRYNDALVNAEKLRGKALYISNGSGTASQTDMIGYRVNEYDQALPEAISGALTTTVEGGVIEAATNSCTHDLRAKLNSMNIPAHYEFRKAGTHSWAMWFDDMSRSWDTTFGPALVGDNFVPASPLELDRPTWNANSSSS